MKSEAARRPSPIQAAVAVVAMALGLTAAPASALSSGKADYVALGDSYAAGQGAMPYENLSCFVSQRGYPALADTQRSAKLKQNAACSGYRVQDVIQELPRKLKRNTDIVTVTVGANDLNAVGVLTSCLPGVQAPGCSAALQYAQARLGDGSLAASLQALIAKVRVAAPEAKIVLTGYPRPFAPGDPFGDVANRMADSLNALISSVAHDNGTTFVDVSVAFAGHGIGSSDSWINFNPAAPDDPANFHPTADGYQNGYYASLVNAGVFK